MNSIDITDSAFSLGITDSNEIVGGTSGTDYTMFIYIGAAILVIFIGMLIYKFYQNKKNNEDTQLDCEGGFCTMGDRPMPPPTQNQYAN